MNCFNDNNPATAICINCGKAICSSCHLQQDNGAITCSPECGKEVEKHHDFYNMQYSMFRSYIWLTAFSTVIMGVLFIAFAFWADTCIGFYYFLSSGLVCVIVGVAYPFSSKLWKKHQYNGKIPR